MSKEQHRAEEKYERGRPIIKFQKISWSCNLMTDNNCVVWTHKNVQNSSSCPLCVNHFMSKHKDDNFCNESWFVSNETNKYRVNVNDGQIVWDNYFFRFLNSIAMPNCVGSRRNTRIWVHGPMFSQELKQQLVDITGIIINLIKISFSLFNFLSGLLRQNILSLTIWSYRHLTHLIIILIFYPTIFSQSCIIHALHNSWF